RAGAGRRSAHRAAGGSAIHRRLHEDRHRLFLRHRARRSGQARPAPALHGRGRRSRPPPAQRVRRRPHERRATGDGLMSLDKEVTEYTSKTARSRALHEEAVAVMPGGNSRTTTFFDPYPFYFQRGQGAHHGTHDWVMVSVSPDPKAAGNRKRPKPVAWSAGIPPAVLKHVVVLPWNDQEACAEILAKDGEQIAALIVDPILCNAGLILPADGFLPWLREETQRRGIVLIFDEVISFRVAWGGAQ